MNATGSLSIVGRNDELAVLGSLLGAARAGSAAQVIIEGEPGIGKTRLIEEVLSRADGFASFRAVSEELQRDRPFGPMVDAFGLGGDASDSHRRAVAELLHADPGSGDHRYRIVEAIEDLLEREAIAQPVLLVTEDVHWADPGTILALHRIARRDDIPILTVVTCRPVPRSEELRRLVDGLADAGATHLKLPPLAEGAVAELASSRLGAEPGPVLRAQLARASGNPLFVLELLDGLDEEDMIERRDGAAETSKTVQPPPSLRTVIVRRLGSLSRGSLDLLRTASVLGETFSSDELATVTATTLATTLKVLEEPLAAGFVSADGDAFTFRHDLVREALYADIAPAVRKGMHLHAARALAAAGAPPARIAEHVALGAEPGDRQAVAWLRDAAFEIASSAPVTAAQLRRRAAELLPRGDLERLSLLLPAVHLLATAGRIDDASALAEELAPLVEGTPLQIGLDIERMNFLVLQLRMDDVERYARHVLERPSLPEVYRVHVIALAVSMRALIRDAEALQELDHEVRPYARDHPNSVPAGMLSWFDGITSWMHGRFSTGGDHFAAALPATEVFIGGSGQGLTIFGAAQALADDIDRAMDTMQRARRQLEERGMVQYLIEHHWLLGAVLFVAGRWDEALAEVAASRDLAAETGAVGTASVLADPTPLVHAFRGDAAAARRALESMEQGPTLVGALFENFVARAVACEAAGNRNAAARELDSWQRSLEGFGFVPDFRTTGRTLVRIARADAGLLERLHDAAQAALDANDGVRSAEGAALLVAGAVRGETQTLLAAVEAARAGGRPFDIAEACAEAAVASLRDGDRETSAQLADEAFRRYEELGASFCESVLSRELRDLGVRRGTRRPRSMARHGWDALTPTELRVVGFVAEGLTNSEIGSRLYVSRGTVATHLRSVFRKLGVTSRRELAAQAAGRLR